MISWTDVVRGITLSTREEVELRKTYVAVFTNLPENGVLDHVRPDGSRLVIYIQTPPTTAESV